MWRAVSFCKGTVPILGVKLGDLPVADCGALRGCGGYSGLQPCL
jgi:hypothetical protein